MKYIEYLNFPSIPKQFIKSADEIIKLHKLANPEVADQYNNVFSTREVEPELYEWLITTFDFELAVQYQIINQGIPIHKDKGNRLIAYNYLLATGGEDVITSVYDDNKELLQSEKLQLKRWHKLETGYFHGVEGIDPNSSRVSISITPKHGRG
jgi:hypothetical protein